MNRPWYIDFRENPMMLSKVDIAKNLIIEDVDNKNTQVFWEVRHFAKAISKDNDKFRIGPWWAHQRCLVGLIRFFLSYKNAADVEIVLYTMAQDGLQEATMTNW